jgi:hypothetical protein
MRIGLIVTNNKKFAESRERCLRDYGRQPSSPRRTEPPDLAGPKE